MQAYQFIKYDKNTLVKHIEKVSATGAVVCFDFEDGIVNPLEIDKTSELKDEARKQFRILYSLIRSLSDDIKIGIRLNNTGTADFEKDLIALKGTVLDSIFTPKAEQSSQVQLIISQLNEFNIEYQNLVPIIETKKGLENLEDILESNKIIRRIAFGHCDYNLSIGAYPFFHQDSWQYWKWLAELESKTEKYNVGLLNSVYLNFGNEIFYCSMLDYLAKRKCFHGQLTLTTRQSELCICRNAGWMNFRDLLENRNLISTGIQAAYDLVSEFETHNKHKGLSKLNNMFISLQEYIASKKFISDQKIINEICFVGGCFPVQHDIAFENLFHQNLRRKIEEEFKNRLIVNIIRYERFSHALDQLKDLSKIKKFDLIVFHVRPEPYLRSVKFFYKYIDNYGQKKWSLNLPFLRQVYSEKYDLLDLGRRFQVNVSQRKSVFHKFLISCNYIFGCIIGNKQFAIQNYYKSTERIIDFCNSHGIGYLVLGPNRRNNTFLEPWLCRDLDSYFSSRIKKQLYICGYENDTISPMNQENGIHVTQHYHDVIAQKLYQTIRANKLLTQQR